MLDRLILQASSYAADIDGLILLVLVLVGFWFLLAEGLFFWLIWRFRANAEMFDGPIYGNGVLVVGTKEGYVHAINAKTGKEKWTLKTGDDIISGATIYKNKVFIGSVDSNFYCLDFSTGKEIWKSESGTWPILLFVFRKPSCTKILKNTLSSRA